MGHEEVVLDTAWLVPVDVIPCMDEEEKEGWSMVCRGEPVPDVLVAVGTMPMADNMLLGDEEEGLCEGLCEEFIEAGWL